jgi:hypothetical protein
MHLIDSGTCGRQQSKYAGYQRYLLATRGVEIYRGDNVDKTAIVNITDIWNNAMITVWYSKMMSDIKLHINQINITLKVC